MLVQELVAAESLTQLNRQWLLLSLLMSLIMRMEVLFKSAPLQQCYSLTFLFNSTQGSRDGLRPPSSGVRLRPLFRNFARPTSEFVLEADG